VESDHLERVEKYLFLKSKHRDLAIGKVFYSEILGGVLYKLTWPEDSLGGVLYKLHTKILGGVLYKFHTWRF